MQRLAPGYERTWAWKTREGRRGTSDERPRETPDKVSLAVISTDHTGDRRMSVNVGQGLRRASRPHESLLSPLRLRRCGRSRLCRLFGSSQTPKRQAVHLQGSEEPRAADPKGIS